MMRARGEALASHRADLTYARGLYRLFRSHGLKDVAMEGFSTTFRGGSKDSMLEKANSLQSKDEILATGALTEVEFEEAVRLMDDPEWVRFSPLMISVWGRNPSRFDLGTLALHFRPARDDRFDPSFGNDPVTLAAEMGPSTFESRFPSFMASE